MDQRVGQGLQPVHMDEDRRRHLRDTRRLLPTIPMLIHPALFTAPSGGAIRAARRAAHAPPPRSPSPPRQAGGPRRGEPRAPNPPRAAAPPRRSIVGVRARGVRAGRRGEGGGPPGGVMPVVSATPHAPPRGDAKVALSPRKDCQGNPSQKRQSHERCGQRYVHRHGGGRRGAGVLRDARCTERALVGGPAFALSHT